MFESIASIMSNSNVNCHCCPYGFHIDRDFVQYCESLYNIAQLEKLKQRRRERRKELLTVESCLGLNILNPVCNQDSSRTSTMRVHDEFDTENVPLPDLDDVMSDFEDTWQKSLNKKTSPHENKRKISNIPESFRKIPNLSKLSSNSINIPTIPSFINIQTLSNNDEAKQNKVPITENQNLVSQKMAVSIEMLSEAGLCHSTIGIHRDVLTTIREQMATSLKHMKQLEEKVKSIPTLQVEVFMLKKEKTMLLNQLKARNLVSTFKNFQHVHALHNKEALNSINDSAIKLSAENLASPALAYSLNDKVVNNGSINSEYSNELSKEKNVRNVGTCCSVLTRDIGVGHIKNKCKSTGVGGENIANIPLCFRCLQETGTDQFISMSSESLESDTDFQCGSNNEFSSLNSPARWSKMYAKSNINKDILPSSPSCKIHYNTSSEFQSSTTSNAPLPDVLTLLELDCKQIATRCKSTPELSLKHNKAIQVSNTRNCRCEISTNVVAQTKESFLERKAPKSCDVAVGDYRIDDIRCQNCITKSFRNVSIGQCSVFDVVCDNCIEKELQSVECQTQISDLQANRFDRDDVDTITEDVSIDQPVLNCTCNRSVNRNKIEEKPLVRSIGTGSVKTSVRTTNMNNPQMCEKCTVVIHLLTQDFISKSREVIESCEKEEFKSDIIVLYGAQPLADIIHSASYKSSSNEDNISHKESIAIETELLDHEIKSSTSNFLNSTESKQPDCFAAIAKHAENSAQSMLSDRQTSVNPFTVIETERIKLSEEVQTACEVFSDYLLKPKQDLEKKMTTSIKIIEMEWFRIANLKNADPHIIEGYLDAFEEISRPLLQHIVNLSDTNGNTAIHYAVSCSNFDVVSILVDSKLCDVNKLNKAGYTCIMLLALADLKNDSHNYVVQRLFQMGDINIKSKQNGQTALMLAVSRGKIEVVQMLLEAGSEINLQDNDGSTALMCAAEHGHINIVQLLLSHSDCDPTISDSDGSNALSIAMEAGHKDIGLLIYANMNFSRGSSPFPGSKHRRLSSSRSTTPVRTPTVRTPPSPSSRSTSSLPSTFSFCN